MAAVGWIFHESALRSLGYLLVEDDGAQKADAIVVLGGDDYGERILKAGELAKARYAPLVLISGPASLLGHESDNTIEFARRHGFPVSLFTPLTHSAKSTRSESLVIGDELQRDHVRKILLVTSNYHTHRAAWLIRKELPWLQVAVVPAADPYYAPDRWWKTREGQKVFFFEVSKTFAAWLGD